MIEGTTKHSLELKNLLEKFFNETNANEVSEMLSILLDSYLQHSPDNRLILANTVNLSNKIAVLAFNLEKLNSPKGSLINYKIETPESKCLHN